jgi:hypothetical protein
MLYVDGILVREKNVTGRSATDTVETANTVLPRNLA